MKKISFLFVALLYILSANAQNVFWASKVIKFSSQFGDKEFSAQQVLGPPNALPNYGKSLVAWAPSANSQRASITVEFEKATPVQQIAIGENLLTGSVEKIFLYDEKGKEYQVYNNPYPKPSSPDYARIFNHFIPLTSYKAVRLRLEINFSSFRNIPQIDCIGISPDRQKIVAKINTIEYTSSFPTPENLGPGVNSPYHDMLPIISPDGKTLYFARKKSPENFGVEKKDDIYVSQRQASGMWSKAYNIGAPLNTDEHNFVCAISPDGNTMYLANKYDYRTESQGVAVSQRQKNGTWSKPKPLNISNMYNKSKFACYHLSIDEKVLVMAIEREDTYGDMDLYVSFRYADGNWSEPMNMGKDLNTAGAEASVFIAADGKTLYFSSNGHAGYGDFDMFMSKRLDNTWKNWSTPVNLGSKINTPGMDIYYTIPASGEYAYYSSERTGYGYSDIFRIQLPKELRPDAVRLDQGLFASTDYDLPKLKPYQDPQVSDLDKRIEDLRKQLNQPNASSNSKENSDIANISQQENKISEDLKKLEEQYQAIPSTNNNYIIPDYSYQPTSNYDASYDQKINDLKRQLERVKLEQPSTPTQISSNQTNTNLSDYEKKLAEIQSQNNSNPNIIAQNNTPVKNKNLTAYEEKLQQLQAAQNQPKKEVAAPVRLTPKDSPSKEIQFEESPAITTLPEIEPIANNTSPEKSKASDQPLNEYEEKLRQLQENNKPSTSKPDVSLVNGNNLPIENVAPYIPELPSTAPSKAIVEQPNLEQWNTDKKALEDSIQMLNQMKEQIAQNNFSQQQNTDDLQKKQKELLNEKDQIALSIAQMQLEKDQLALEKEKLEIERKKLDALKNQQYKDINALKRELDSLQALQVTANKNTNAASANYDPSIDDDLNNLKKQVGEKVALKNVYFVVNATFIQSKSHAELDKLALFLIKNKELMMEIGGHTNGLCDDNFCNELSNKRAKSVMDYLITKGVPPARLSYKGYGKSQNIADNNTEQGRKLNQRVEITITKVQ
ncbi:MAG TPA: OmpA family protein [Chitinophagales bacterium]|nr:OmpA family protein [Chitinophagales bacterium]